MPNRFVMSIHRGSPERETMSQPHRFTPGLSLSFRWLVLLLLCTPAGLLAEETRSSGIIGEGTPWETPWYATDSGKPGPVILITGGIHGNEPAGAVAAEQIRHWPVAKGKVVVIPEANRPALAANSRYTPIYEDGKNNLNRNFPTKDRDATTPLAEALWNFVVKVQPDWIIDLHEGYAIHRQNSDSVGSSIICRATDETRPLFDHALAAVNATIDDPGKQFVMLANSDFPVGAMARAGREQLGATTTILETTHNDIRLGVRVREHRLMVNRLLRDLGVVEVGPDELIFPQENDDRIAVAIYNGPGASGHGPELMRQALAKSKQFAPRVIDAGLIQNHRLDQFDVVIFPGGSGSAQARALNEHGREAVREFVADGGGFIGVCAGCYLACDGFSWSLAIMDLQTISDEWRRGVGKLQLAFTPAAGALLNRDKRQATVLYHNGPVMEPADSPQIPDATVLATFATEIAKNGTPKGIQVGSPAIAIGEFGEGRVVGISPHPEQTAGLERIVPRLTIWASGRGSSTKMIEPVVAP